MSTSRSRAESGGSSSVVIAKSGAPAAEAVEIPDATVGGVAVTVERPRRFDVRSQRRGALGGGHARRLRRRRLRTSTDLFARRTSRTRARRARTQHQPPRLPRFERHARRLLRAHRDVLPGGQPCPSPGRVPRLDQRERRTDGPLRVVRQPQPRSAAARRRRARARCSVWATRTRRGSSSPTTTTRTPTSHNSSRPTASATPTGSSAVSSISANGCSRRSSPIARCRPTSIPGVAERRRGQDRRGPRRRPTTAKISGSSSSTRRAACPKAGSSPFGSIQGEPARPRSRT